jgi:hypothetical protein
MTASPELPIAHPVSSRFAPTIAAYSVCRRTQDDAIQLVLSELTRLCIE